MQESIVLLYKIDGVAVSKPAGTCLDLGMYQLVNLQHISSFL